MAGFSIVTLLSRGQQVQNMAVVSHQTTQEDPQLLGDKLHAKSERSSLFSIFKGVTAPLQPFQPPPPSYSKVHHAIYIWHILSQVWALYKYFYYFMAVMSWVTMVRYTKPIQKIISQSCNFLLILIYLHSQQGCQGFAFVLDAVEQSGEAFAIEGFYLCFAFLRMAKEISINPTFLLDIIVVY